MRKLHWSLLKRFYRLGPRFAVYRRLGRRWLLDNRNWVDQQLIIRRPYEKKQLLRCREIINQNKVTHFFDIGANFGLYTVLLSDAPSLKQVEAFEPLPRNIDQLGANLYLNALDTRVNVHAVALGDMEQHVPLYVDSHSTGVSTLDPVGLAREFGTYDSSIEVKAHPLDSVVELKSAAVLVKIDVEGAELKVLEGMSRFLAANSVWMQIETTPSSLDDVRRFMTRAGYVEMGSIGADSYFGKAA